MLLMLCAIAWVVWRASQPRRLFVLRVESGQLRVVRGTVTAAFLQRVCEVIAEDGIVAGQGLGVGDREHRIRLDFTGPIPQAACQQLRNGWSIGGWRSRPHRR
jgi:hypothetical protein